MFLPSSTGFFFQRRLEADRPGTILYKKEAAWQTTSLPKPQSQMFLEKVAPWSEELKKQDVDDVISSSCVFVY